MLIHIYNSFFNGIITPLILNIDKWMMAYNKKLVVTFSKVCNYKHIIL